LLAEGRFWENAVQNTATKSIRAVERAVDVLRCLARGGEPLGVTEIQRHVKLSRPTLYRLLNALERKGLVRSAGDPQRIALDYRVVELAGAWLGGNDVVAAAQPHLNALWLATDETVAMFVPADSRTKICVQELRSRQALVFIRGVGFTEAMTVGSSGKAILAFMPEEDIVGALAILPDEAAREAIRRDLARIRRHGYSLSAGEVIKGASAMAAPVFDRSGHVRGSVSVFGPEARINGEHHAFCLNHLRQTANAISAAVGHRSGAAAE
jgi:DNA-binding IclR family transcriptional regulator